MIRAALDRLAWWLFDSVVCEFSNLTNDDDEGES